MRTAPRTLMIFVDGLGLGVDDPAINPIYQGACPFLQEVLERRAKPIDAGLFVDGLPQSATGQASLFTGKNAAQHMGRHMEGTPGPTLKELVRQHNIYDKLASRGYASTFANAYYIDDVSEIEKHRRQSVSTVAALKAFGDVRTSEALKRNEAVYQDLTREVLRERGYDGPFITPEEAGGHLVELAAAYDFTLFEYFQTDLMAHRGTAEDVQRVLSHLDRMLKVVFESWRQEGQLLVLTSDHGNIEDNRTRTHTMNPVPLVAVGHGAEALQSSVARIEEFTDALLKLYT